MDALSSRSLLVEDNVMSRFYFFSPLFIFFWPLWTVGSAPSGQVG